MGDAARFDIIPAHAGIQHYSLAAKDAKETRFFLRVVLSRASGFASAYIGGCNLPWIPDCVRIDYFSRAISRRYFCTPG